MTASPAVARAGQSADDWSFRAEGVTKIYGKTLRANEAITLSVRPGEVYTLGQRLSGGIRAGLTNGLVTDLTRCYLILLAWTAAGWIMTGWVVGRRR